MNSVILIGRLTADPEINYTQSQMAVCRFTLAVDRMKKGEADFIRVTVFDRQAENCDRYLSKGRQAAVRGHIQTGSYTNRYGQKVYTTDVIADRVEFIGSQGENSRSDASYQQSESSYQPQQKQSSWGDLPQGFSASNDDVPY